MVILSRYGEPKGGQKEKEKIHKIHLKYIWRSIMTIRVEYSSYFEKKIIKLGQSEVTDKEGFKK